jgi:uncharacterized protein YkwD
MRQTKSRGRCVLYAGCALVSLLLACGGSASSPTDPGGPGIAEAEVEYFSFELVNRARESEGSGELGYDETLSSVAREHSRRMRDGDFFSHVDPQGQDFSDRLRAAGVHVMVAGENLAIVEGSGSPASNAHRAFLDNPGHRANLLDPRFTHGGVGVARRGDSFWITQLFVRR